jgi:hypothetical protein
MDYQPTKPTTTTPGPSVRLAVLQRKPVWVSITISAGLFETLVARATEEGRSLSNLCAFLLERSAADHLTK